MKMLRNPEIKKTLILYLLLSIAAIAVGFLFGARCAVFAAVLCAAFIAVYFWTTFYRYRNIEELTRKLDEILYNGKKFNICENSEGELSILKNEIQKLIIMLHSQADELEKEKLYLSDSIANISHQLRTPLTSINLILNLLSQADISQERRLELIAQLTQMIRKTDSLVITLLKIAQIDAGRVVFEKKRIGISELIAKAVEPLEILLDIRGQRFNVKAGEEYLMCDAAWTAEALGNIFKNCSEHMPDTGEISVTVRQTPLFVELEICDTGCGFTEEELPHIFERFYKGGGSKAENFGIGMSLAKMIIEKQNGTIKAENRQSGGARFVIRFYESYDGENNKR